VANVFRSNPQKSYNFETFYDIRYIDPRTTLKLRNHLFLAVRHCVLNMPFISGGRLLRLQPKTHHAVVKWYSLSMVNKASNCPCPRKYSH
jgi:hypothetical protein